MNALKTKVLLLSLLSCSLGMYAQNKIGFGYDAAGNRIKREIIMSQARCQSKEQVAFYSDMLNDRWVNILPNSTNGTLRVKVLNGDDSMSGKVVVFSLSGAKVASCPIIDNVAYVDISSSANGIYILRVYIGDSSTSWKIIKK